MSPFEFKTYREYLRALCKQPSSERGFQASLAKAAGCQASYFSQVLQEKAHLTEDQALGVAERLEFSKQEVEHFLLLLRFEKASTPKLRHYLESRIHHSLKESRKVGQKVPANKTLLKEEDIGRYFISWIPSAVHLLISNSDYGTAKAIAQRLNIPIKTVEESLEQLAGLEFIEKRDGKWFYKGGSVHVPKDSPWQPMMQTARRQMASRSIALNPEDAIHFSSVFTISPGDVEEIKRLIKPFLDKSHRLVQKSGTEELHCLCLDFFPVI
jgi:uncharacterized protein (TIGR02147 family)